MQDFVVSLGSETTLSWQICHGFGNANHSSGKLDAYDVFLRKEGTQVKNGTHFQYSSYHSRYISCQQNQYHDIYLAAFDHKYMK